MVVGMGGGGAGDVSPHVSSQYRRQKKICWRCGNQEGRFGSRLHGPVVVVYGREVQEGEVVYARAM